MTINDLNDVPSAALWFGAQGMRVFPVIRNGKTPAIKRWQENASDDPQTIIEWFALSHAGFNFGVVADKLIVLDVDTHSDAKHGPTTLSELETVHGALPGTFTVRTATGGVHFYFRNPGTVPVTKGADKAGPGLDIQTGNAYLVGPCSTIGDNGYTIIDPQPIAECPAWLLELIKDKPVEPVKVHRVASPAAPVSDKYVSAAVQGELDRLNDCARSGWGGPAWDSTTYEVACNLIEISNTPGSDYSQSTAYSDFMANAPTDEKFGPRQHEAKWNSALRKVGGATRVFPAARVHDVSVVPLPADDDAPPLEDDGFLPPSTPSRRLKDPDEFFGKNGLLVEKLANDVKHDFGLGPDGELWLYQGGIYRPDSMELMRRVTQRLRDRYRPGHFNSVKDFVSAMPELPALTTEQPDPRFIVLSNGVYAWQESALRPHSHTYGAITQLPVVFDAEATCPEFERYLSEVVPADTVNLVWELIGYLMMFGNPMQRAVILQGPGGNGKSLFLRVIQNMLGKQNVSALSLRQITEDRFSMAGLLGKTANLAGDIDSKYLSDASRFKQLVGGDLIDAERKYGQPFTFEPYAVPVFSANEFWKTGDTTHGYFRRWLPIPFPYPVVGTRKLNENDLFAETPGIFNRAMIGLRTLMARGDFEYSESVNALRKLMENSADILADWFAEDDSIVAAEPTNDALKTPRTDAYKSFQRWCMSSGHKGMASTNFYKRLAQLGYGEAKVRGVRYFYGLEIAPHAQPTIGNI